jgi:uncharacterized protein (TIGR02646 family)
MKRICKGIPPQALQDYASANPGATWDQMRDDNAQGGSEAARECRDQAVRDQCGLCAYCEQRITPDDPIRCCVEHFHPKSDKSGMRNWGLEWPNMMAVCDGGSRSKKEERASHPLPENLSCDAHKDRMIQTGKLPGVCEGYLLSPFDVPAFPNLYAVDKGTGHIKPNDAVCASVAIPGNAYGTTAELVSRTIAALNLNCERLAEKRRRLVVDIDRNKKVLRQNNVPPAEAPDRLNKRYFNVKWPEFFTTLRCCLGQAAEDYLHSLGYQW